MTQLPKPRTSTEVIAERMRQLMAAKGWTAQRLVDELAEEGIQWTRLIVANLLASAPGRRRRYVTIDEWLALAYVLDVAPIHLLIPIDAEDDLYAATPELWTAAGQARAWIRGQMPLDEQDMRIYFSQVPASEFAPLYGTPDKPTEKPSEAQIELESQQVREKRRRRTNG